MTLFIHYNSLTPAYCQLSPTDPCSCILLPYPSSLLNSPSKTAKSKSIVLLVKYRFSQQHQPVYNQICHQERHVSPWPCLSWRLSLQGSNTAFEFKVFSNIANMYNSYSFPKYYSWIIYRKHKQTVIAKFHPLLIWHEQLLCATVTWQIQTTIKTTQSYGVFMRNMPNVLPQTKLQAHFCQVIFI